MKHEWKGILLVPASPVKLVQVICFQFGTVLDVIVDPVAAQVAACAV